MRAMKNSVRDALMSASGKLVLTLAALLGFALPVRAAVVEFYEPELDQYFITAGLAEQAMVDSGAVGHWQRTGQSFEAGGSTAVCRFYGNTQTNPATGGMYGPNSHFYTVDPNECAWLRSIYRPDAPSWQFESYDFLSTPAASGTCGTGLTPIYRAYNDGAARGIAPNHRITGGLGAYFETTARGWSPEGAVMCAPSPAGTCSAAQLDALEAAMSSTLAQTSTNADYTLLMESFDGRSYSHSRGNSSGQTRYESASTSKWVTAATILSLVDRGFLSLDSHPQDFIDFWRLPADHPANSLTLRQLLDFTSGFYDEPLCENLPTADFTTCVENIFQKNLAYRIPPGTQYYYSSTHLQIAGLMAIRARGFSTWGQVFDEFRARTGLFPTSSYDLPSASNPRLAGGMHWTGEEYLGFLRALAHRQVLSDRLSAQLFSYQRGNAQVIKSPAVDASGLDWGYALGNWVECASTHYNCGEHIGRNSSPGAYGAYPFIDFDHGYFGLVARQGPLGTAFEGVNLFNAVAAGAAQWAQRSCAAN
jgi:CubicO group peptidase (beta-lactamase class C family)